MKRELDGHVAVVTGGGRGIGRETARLLARRGARVVVADLDADAARGVAEEIDASGGGALAAAIDVRDAGQLRRMAALARERFGRVSVLVNSAGVLRPTRVEDIPEEEWDLVVEVNLKGTFLASQAVLPQMRKAGYGRIVNLSSTAGKSVSTVGGAHYTAAKAGVLGFTRHLASEVAADGITVNAVCPGLIDTEMVRSTIDEERRRRLAADFPIPRLGAPSEVAELIVFLASDRAGYITGAAFDITGGDLMV